MNSQEVIVTMPEYTKAQADLDAMRKRLTFLNHIQTVHFVFGQVTGMLVELHTEGLTGD